MTSKHHFILSSPISAFIASSVMLSTTAPAQTVFNEYTKLVAADGESGDLFARVIDINQGLVAVGAKFDDGAALNSGSVYIFDAKSGTQLHHLFPDDGAEDDGFGNAVAISTEFVAVGAQNVDAHGTDSGAVYIFDTSTAQQLFKLTPDDGEEIDRFGFSVALGDQIVAISAPNDNDQGATAGSVYLFDLTTGQQLNKLYANDAMPGDWFGDSLAIDANTLVVGSPNTDNPASRTGSAYLFDLTTGAQLHHLIAQDAIANHRFGQAIAIDNGFVVVGVQEDVNFGADSGAAYIFDAQTGVQLHKLHASNEAAGDQFGIAVDIDDGIVVVSARRNDLLGNNAGTAYMFDATTGQELARLLPEYGSAGDFLGEAISIDDGIVVVGARKENNTGNNAGVVYAFDIQGVTFQDQAFHPNNPDWLDKFGHAVSINNGKIAVGAPDDSEAGESGAGAAYLFDATTGQQLHKFFAPDSNFFDRFGRSIAFDDNTVAVGAPLTNEIGANAGSVYLFDATTGQHTFKLLADDAEGGDIFGHSVSIHNGLVAVGAYAADNPGTSSGAAYIFDANTGQQLFKLLPDDPNRNDEFGASIAIHNGMVIVGSSFDDDNGTSSGSAYLFDAQTGELLYKILPEDGAPAERFGFSVAISDTQIAVGASKDSDSGFDAGSAYVFDLNTGEQLAKFLPDDGAEVDQFGWSVALDSQTLVVGTHSGVSNPGKAYLFDLKTGEQITKLLPTDGHRVDNFGSAVSIDNGVAAVGAPYAGQDIEQPGSTYTYTIGGPVCQGDLTKDGVINFFDVSAFLQLYAAQDLTIDFTNDGIVNFFDISYFIQLVQAGCP